MFFFFSPYDTYPCQLSRDQEHEEEEEAGEEVDEGGGEEEDEKKQVVFLASSTSNEHVNLVVLIPAIFVKVGRVFIAIQL